MVWARVGLLIAVGLAAWGQQEEVKPVVAEACRVEVRAYLPGGKEVESVELEAGGRKFAAGRGRVVELQCGRQRLLARSRCCELEERDVELRPGYQILTVSMENGIRVEGYPPREVAVVAGELTGDWRGPGCDLLRLVPVVGEGRAAEVKVSLGTGRFGAEELAPGLYVAVVVGQDGICGTGTFRLERGNALSLRVGMRR